MAVSTSEHLRSIADTIDNFPKFIRRDLGGKSVRDTLADTLKQHGIEPTDDLVEDLDLVTVRMRQTVLTYFANQFL